MGIAMGVQAAAMSLPSLAGTSILAGVSLIGTVAYILAFSIGAGPVPGLLAPELFPQTLRAKGTSLVRITKPREKSTYCSTTSTASMTSTTPTNSISSTNTTNSANSTNSTTNKPKAMLSHWVCNSVVGYCFLRSVAAYGKFGFCCDGASLRSFIPAFHTIAAILSRRPVVKPTTHSTHSRHGRSVRVLRCDMCGGCLFRRLRGEGVEGGRGGSLNGAWGGARGRARTRHVPAALQRRFQVQARAAYALLLRCWDQAGTQA